MQPTHPQIEFLNRRKKIIQAWRWVGPLILLLLTLFLALQYLRTPLLFNPGEVAHRIQAGTLDHSTLETLAILLPVLSLTVFFILFCIIGFIYASLRNEKTYLDLLDQDNATEV